jgi:SAM-dependent methyltransferase
LWPRAAPAGHGAEAQARNPDLEAQQADVRRLPFQPDSFDVVFSGSSLDHFDSETEIVVALAELARVLRPGGCLILTLDNPTNPLIALRNGVPQSVLRRVGIVPYHVGVTLERGALLQALRAEGLEVLQTKAVQHCPRVLAVLLARPTGRLPRFCRNLFVRGLAGFEQLACLPSRWFTAHYIAVLAQKR